MASPSSFRSSAAWQAALEEKGLDLMVVLGAPGDYQQDTAGSAFVEARWADAVVLAWTRRQR